MDRAYVVVMTYEIRLYDMLKAELYRSDCCESVTHIKNILEIESKLIKSRINVLIVDTDNSLVSSIFLQRMVEKFKLLVIFTGIDTSKATLLMKGQLKEFIIKPSLNLVSNNYINEISKKIKLFILNNESLSYNAMLKTVGINQKIIAIASSTGGTDALERIFTQFPEDIPPILVVQHMPSKFTKLFAERINKLCKPEVKEASSNDYLRKGLILIAPGDKHMTLIISNSRLAVNCEVGTKVHGVMPSADVLFNSVANVMKSNSIGVILTGMGKDGARGILMMRNNGAYTIGQDEESSVVYGMPKHAYELGAINKQLHLDKISSHILDVADNK